VQLFPLVRVTTILEVACVPIHCCGGFDTIPRTRLRHERSQSSCNVANFILVNWEPEVGRGGSGGRTRGEKKGREKERKKGVKSDNSSRRGKGRRGDQLPPPRVQRCPVSSVSMQARRFQWGWVPGKQQWEWKKKTTVPSGEHVLSFYSDVCPRAECILVRAVRARHATCLGSPSHASLCASQRGTFLQVVVAVSSEIRKRWWSNGKVETKPVRSSLLQHVFKLKQ